MTILSVCLITQAVIFSDCERTNKNALRIPIRNTEDEKYISVVPPQFVAISQGRPYQVLTYLSSVTGTPVASY